MNQVRVWTEKTVIPTYEIGEAEKNPIFLEKRVYQGSCGKVYPYPTVEKISDVKVDKEYHAVYLENEYLKVMVLPELGGRIQRAYDKTNGYDFVYYNEVIKPALVGLTGPWISGGIEFNWPQHHRPTTFLPVDYELQEHADGSCSVLCHDVDQMYGTKSIAKITLYPGKAYIEIQGQLYNRTSLPQTFLWWANPAVAVNDNTQSVFPPDVHAVMDHGKRDVSRFPIATGVYYKHDYSEGVDISRYRNIPVPTSYMAEKSDYDFVGGYDYGVSAGILHVADHHVSPGKKQWTWGCGDFGKAWDRNLTDENGPYIELMTGMFTDNQPDFTWLKPFEEKTFTQYFMPYKKLGYVQNASKEAVLSLQVKEKDVVLRVYTTGERPETVIRLAYDGRELSREMAAVSPVNVYEKTISKSEIACLAGIEEACFAQEKLWVGIYAQEQCLVEYQPEKKGIHKMPEPAHAADLPEKIQTNEELYLTGQHIEQYRHATFQPDPYYLEGLKRDPGDIRINNAYGALLMRRGNCREAQKYFEKALERLTFRNPNPYHSESYYLLGLSLWYQGQEEKAYDAFYKATWSYEQAEKSYYYLAAIDAKGGRWQKALSHIENALIRNSHNVKARGMKSYLLRKLGRTQEAAEWTGESLRIDPFDFVSGYETILQNPKSEAEKTLWGSRMRGFRENYLMAARDYAEFGAYIEALAVLKACPDAFALIPYYQAYYLQQLDGFGTEEVKQLLERAEQMAADYCFPNKPEDIPVLRFAIENGCKRKAPYYLGNLFYDRLQWQEAQALWELSADADPSFATVWRNLSLVYYNKCGDGAKAKAAMEKAFALNQSDARIFLELDQLYRKLGYSYEQRLEFYEAHTELLKGRDDLYTEYITVVNMCGQHERAYELMSGHRFHPWEGGEGKITAQYVLALLEMAKKAIGREAYEEAGRLLKQALVYPENLGEGKLEGTKDNHIYYYLGIVSEKLAEQGIETELPAQTCFELATLGTDEPAGALFYNDQPADMILYQGLSYLKLGKTAQAKARFYRLIDYGEQHLEDAGSVGYFAVSLPDFLIFDEDYTRRNRVHCLYLCGLGHLGLGEPEKAASYLEQAAALDPSHMMCRIYGKSTLCLW